MSNCVLRIEKLENGYEVEVYDEAIGKKNDSPKSQYKDPWKGYAFTTADEVKTFVGEHLDSLKPPPDADEEYSNEWKKQTAE